jgi:hypothetical protein
LQFASDRFTARAEELARSGADRVVLTGDNAFEWGLLTRAEPGYG